MAQDERTTNSEDAAVAELERANPVREADETADSPRAERVYRAAIGGGRQEAPRTARVAAFAGGLAAIVAVAVGGTVMLNSGGGSDTEPGGGSAVTNPDDSDGEGAAGGGLSASCIGYSVEELQLRQFAFAGTVTAIEETEGEFGPSQQVTFAVDEVLSGSPGETITLQSDSTLTNSMYSDFTIEVGERYLVSGDEVFAWGCGFTRPFDEDLAEEWREALSN